MKVETLVSLSSGNIPLHAGEPHEVAGDTFRIVSRCEIQRAESELQAVAVHLQPGL